MKVKKMTEYEKQAKKLIAESEIDEYCDQYSCNHS